jgi:hypothetical protein
MVNLLESMHKCCLPSGVPSESPGAFEKSLVHKIFGGRLRSQVLDLVGFLWRWLLLGQKPKSHSKKVPLTLQTILVRMTWLYKNLIWFQSLLMLVTHDYIHTPSSIVVLGVKRYWENLKSRIEKKERRHEMGLSSVAMGYAQYKNLIWFKPINLSHQSFISTL